MSERFVSPILNAIFRERDKPRWKCHVSFCPKWIDNGDLYCAACKQDADDFKRQQELCDEWFKKLSDTNYLGCLLRFPIPKNEAFEEYFTRYLKEMLHRRDEEIAAQINKNWTRKLSSTPHPNV